MSNFLDKLKKSLDEGKADESVTSQYNEIVTKSVMYENGTLKYDNSGVDQRKPLSEEERKEIEFLAMKEQEKIDEFEFNGKLSAALVNVDLLIEKLTNKITDLKVLSDNLRDSSIPVYDKKLLMRKLVEEINRFETPIAKQERFLINDDEILTEDSEIVDKLD